MLRSVAIEGYRGFRQFGLHDLGRVNLIVGTNNSGKTSVLEAVNLLAANGDFSVLWHTLSRRGEDVEDRESRSGYRGVDVRRLFHGHDARLGSRFSITGTTREGEGLFVFAEVVAAEQDDAADDDGYYERTGTGTTAAPELPVRPPLVQLEWTGPARHRFVVPMTRRAALSYDVVSRLPRPLEAQRPNIRFITAASLSPEAVVELFEEVVLTPDEDLVLDALRIIEPSIERIASAGIDRYKGSGPRAPGRGGLLVRCKGVGDRIPIGSMGDGIWRLLGLALALARAENGLLLVDEIDTGLHYTVMEDMWKLVSETAKRLNTQVFATTHSRDCYESLAAVCSKAVSERSEVTIQRIERGRTRSTAYTEQEIIAAAERGLEVR